MGIATHTDNVRIERIAVLRALYLGDLVLATPALRPLRAGFPDAEITLIALPWAQSLASGLSHWVDRVIPFGGYPGLNDTPLSAERSRTFVAEQQAYGYDLVIQLHGSGATSNPCARDLGGRLTAGYYLGQRPPYLSVAAPYPDHLPEVLRCLQLMRLIGCPERGTQLEVRLTPQDRLQAHRLLAFTGGDGPLIGLHPGAKSALRRWPPEQFAQLARSLARRYDARIVVTGERHDESVVELLDRVEVPVTDLSGRTPLGTLAAVLASLDLLVVNNTGPAHLAEAVGTPTVRIFDLDETWRWAPLDRTRHCIVPGTPADAPRRDVQWWEWPEPDEVERAVASLLTSISDVKGVARATR